MNHYLSGAWITGLIMILISTSVGAMTEAQENMKRDESAQKAVVIIGASYAKGLKINHIGGSPVINNGVGGEETKATVKRFQQDVLDHNPKAVIIWGFINNIFRADANKMETTLQETRKHFEFMTKAALERGIKPILVTEITMAYPDTFMEKLARFVGGVLGKKSYQDYINGHVVSVNNWLRQYAQRNELQLLDFQQVFEEEPNGARKSEYATDDASHITPAGYEVLKAHTLERLGSSL